jgi:long-subunit fatty acid transport protein
MFRNVILAVGVSSLFTAHAFAAGIEHPDNGAIAIGRGGAMAANPSNGMAFQYNPAGLAQQSGLRIHLDAKLADQKLKFDSALGGSAENKGGIFFAPAGALSYGLGEVGPFKALTVALGGTGPSAIGKLDYGTGTPARYALHNSDYFIAYLSGAVAVKYGDYLALGITGQLVQGHAKFAQSIWAGTDPGTDVSEDAVASIDVKSGFIPTGVFGLTLTPIEGMAIGASYRPRIHFEADGTLKAGFSEFARNLGAEQYGDKATLKLAFPDVFRLGVLYALNSDLDVEIDFVWERWSILERIEIITEGIEVGVPALGTRKPLDNVVFEKDFRDAGSLRLGGDYKLIPDRLIARLGYMYETSAIPKRSVSVDFGNWGRHVVSVGASVAFFGAWLDIGYAHHFLETQEVKKSQVVQVVGPCLRTQACEPAEPTVIGNGTYTGSLDLFAFSIRVPFDEIKGEL